MKNTLVLYYSKSGNNKFIAEKIQSSLNADIEEIKSKPHVFFISILATLLKISLPIKKLNYNIENYEKIILLSPIWMGNLPSPINFFLNKYKDKIQKLYYITVCGSDDNEKDGKYGYKKVLKKVKKLSENKNTKTYAFSIHLITKKGQSLTDEEIMKVKFSEEIFTDKVKNKFEEIIKDIK